MKKQKKLTKSNMRRYIPLYMMLILPVSYFIIFKYGPMYGISAAFKDYNIFKGLRGSKWVGFKYFKELFSTPGFFSSLKNTLILTIGDLIFTWPIPIIVAILLNELASEKLSKIVEKVTYLPHFLSTVIIAGIFYQIFAPTGVINNVVTSIFHCNPIPFLTSNNGWRVTYWLASIWEGTGYGMIVYLAAIGGINKELYDAAYIDGAGRFRRIWHVTLPQIRPTIVTILIMNTGRIFSIGFEKPYFMRNVLVEDASDVISLYTYRLGLQSGRYDFATAVGLFQSIVALVLVLTVNKIAKKLGEEGLF
ncbi:MAG: sugar ABC transporter permease [Sphaerochaetaceae bacterium]|nr:sugar ABC transporter permease [Sphaerochaetaceae bacterium]